jgi:DNA-binding transcriptional ArsR family regulator
MAGEQDPFLTNNTSSNVTFVFTRPGVYNDIYYRYRVGHHSTTSDTGNLSVMNVPPDAEITHPRFGERVEMGSRTKFKAWGWDTPSDSGTLRYTWDFGDGEIAEGVDAVHEFGEAGTYTVTLTVEDDHGATKVVTMKVMVDEAPSIDAVRISQIATGFAVIFALVLLAITEPSKYKLGLLAVPLFVSKDRLLDNRTRQTLHEIIVESPGIHFSAIRSKTGMANGVVAYHLDVLERKSLIHSVRDGKLKRFYPVATGVPKDVGRSPEETREAMVALVRRNPGIYQMEIMEELDLDRDSASYYLRELVKDGRLSCEKDGRYTLYKVNGPR